MIPKRFTLGAAVLVLALAGCQATQTPTSSTSEPPARSLLQTGDTATVNTTTSDTTTERGGLGTIGGG